MKICFITSEIFAWGKYGGFGRATRMIGRALAHRGHNVSAIVPQRGNQRAVETLDGITVFGYPLSKPYTMRALCKQCNADIYHSEQPTLGTHWAYDAMPHKKHVVTVQDPKKFYDWLLELRHPSRNIFLSFLAWMYEHNFLVKQALNRVDAVFYCAHYLGEKVQSVYSVKREIVFLPNPIVIPEKHIEKSTVPTVCFVGRWDRRKRPELFFKLAKKYPQVEFIAPGESQDKKWDNLLRLTYGNLSNLNMPGFIDQFTSDALSRILAKSWILINTSTREGLPTSFLEALAHKCAILSSVNPEEVATRFGFLVQNDNFAQGLESLLADNMWCKKGQAGYQYVAKHYELEHTINQHCALYERLLI